MFLSLVDWHKKKREPCVANVTYAKVSTFVDAGKIYLTHVFFFFCSYALHGQPYGIEAERVFNRPLGLAFFSSSVS